MQVTLEPPTRTDPMADGNAGTKTVRINGDAANKLQTIEALKRQMGERFKPVEFLNGLVVDPIEKLYEATLKDFSAFNARKKREGKS